MPPPRSSAINAEKFALSRGRGSQRARNPRGSGGQSHARRSSRHDRPCSRRPTPSLRRRNPDRRRPPAFDATVVNVRDHSCEHQLGHPIVLSAKAHVAVGNVITLRTKQTTGTTMVWPTSVAMRFAAHRTMRSCLPIAMCGPFCSMPPVGT